MAPRRGDREGGFYRRLQLFSTANEWEALLVKPKRKRKRNGDDVFEVENILAERKRKVRRFSYLAFSIQLSRHMEFLIMKDSPFTFVFQGLREFLVKWRGWNSEFNSWEPECHFLDPAIIR